MNDHVKAYLSDIIHYANNVIQFTAGRIFDQYVEDEYFRSAVERQLELMADSVRELLRAAPEYEQSITHARRIADFRNRLAHGYRTLIDQIVWDVATTYVPLLHTEVASLFQALDAGQPGTAETEE